MNFSFSQIKCAYECPFKYKSIYIDKVREPSGIAALFGQAIHRVFKEIVVNDLDRKDTLALWKNTLECEVSNNSDIIVIRDFDFWLKRGYPVIQKFLKEREKLDIKTVIKIEERSSGVYNGDTFSYICDVVYKNSIGQLVILDYKTGKTKITDYYQQVFYSLLQDIKFDKLCLYYVWDGPIFFDVSKHLEATKKYVDEGVSLIKSGVYEKTENKYCKYCYILKKGICDVKL